MTVKPSTKKDKNMKANEVLRKFFKKHGTKQLAATLGLSEPFLYKWCQPDGGKATGGWNPLERVAALTAATGDGMLLDHLCEQAGGRFVRADELPELVRQIWEKFKQELDQMLQSPDRRQQADVCQCPAEGSRCSSGSSRCPNRLPGGRCGFQSAH